MNKERWYHELFDDPDREFLLNGIYNGFNIVPQDTKLQPAFMPNYRSATKANRGKVEETIKSEIAKGNYQIVHEKPTIISALGAIPKPGSDDVRIIHDCSMPKGKGVNDYVHAEKFKFQTLDDAIKLVKPNSYMAKIDLSAAYRSVNVNPASYQALGLQWQFEGNSNTTYMVDTKLCFGAKNAPEVFHRLTQSVKRMMAKRGYEKTVVYLDDFWVTAETYEECNSAFSILLQLLQDLGFGISWNKVVKPTKCLTFLGIEIDSVNEQVRLPETKLAEFKDLLAKFAVKTRASKRQLQQLAGKLNWACRVVHGGRTFLRRILDMLNKLKRPHHKARLDAACKQDLLWWNNFIQNFNGVRLFLDDLPQYSLATDACTKAAGAIFKGDWFYANWDHDLPQFSEEHINVKEALTICLAARRWGHLWQNKRIIVHTDNITAMTHINKGTAHSQVVMTELRHLFWLSTAYNFHIKAIYLPGSQNIVADAISRLHDPYYLLRFYDMYDALHISRSTQLVKHMSHASYLFILSQVLGRYRNLH